MPIDTNLKADIRPLAAHEIAATSGGANSTVGCTPSLIDLLLKLLR